MSGVESEVDSESDAESVKVTLDPPRTVVGVSVAKKLRGARGESPARGSTPIRGDTPVRGDTPHRDADLELSLGEESSSGSRRLARGKGSSPGSGRLGGRLGMRGGSRWSK